MSPATIRPGDRVHDRDDADPDDAIVVNQPPMTASEWTVESRDCTLAEDNPDYPDDAAVAVVCFCDDLIEYGPPFDPTEQQPLSLAALNESGVNFYTFPAPRLTVLESPATGLPDTATTEDDESEPETETTPAKATAETAADPSTDTTEASETGSDDADDTAASEETDTGPSPELTHLKTTLEADGLSVAIEDNETLTVERLGQTYYIRPGKEIEGDGALRSQLETLVENAT